MIAFAAFVVETDDTPAVLAIKQSILEHVGATGNGFWHLPHNDLDNRTVWQNSFERWTRIAAIVLSFMPSLRPVVKDSNGALKLIGGSLQGIYAWNILLT